jgi:hypothetical protein
VARLINLFIAWLADLILVRRKSRVHRSAISSDSAGPWIIPDAVGSVYVILWKNTTPSDHDLLQGKYYLFIPLSPLLYIYIVFSQFG